MAGKGGGAWKVAYADFVTAMMAFFLVMWITAQDQQVKQAVSYYFVDPMGSSKKSSKNGSVAQHLQNGTVPQAESVSQGKGRKSHTNPEEPSPSTKAVHEWLVEDKSASEYWQNQANQARDAAARSPEVKSKAIDERDEAVRRLSKQMQSELKEGVPVKARGIYQDLLVNSLNDVNWTQLAEDILKTN